MFGYMILNNSLYDDRTCINFEIGKIYGSIIPCLFFKSYRFFECPYDIDLNYIKENHIIVMIKILGCVVWCDSDNNMYTNQIKIIKKVDIDNLFDLHIDGKYTTQFGDIYRYKNKKLNSENDKPARIKHRGRNQIEEWYKDGKYIGCNIKRAYNYPITFF